VRIAQSAILSFLAAVVTMASLTLAYPDQINTALAQVEPVPASIRCYFIPPPAVTASRTASDTIRITITAQPQPVTLGNRLRYLSIPTAEAAPSVTQVLNNPPRRIVPTGDADRDAVFTRFQLTDRPTTVSYEVPVTDPATTHWVYIQDSCRETAEPRRVSLGPPNVAQTATPIPPTATPTATSTFTPSATPTGTLVPPTDTPTPTNTPLVPTATFTHTPTLTPTSTATATSTTTATPTSTPVDGEATWPMAAGNVERTSYTSAEGPTGQLYAACAIPIDAYVPTAAGVVAAEGQAYVSTAGGLIAFDATNCSKVWDYATELPLGHSPTYDGGYLYVGGLDRQLHKVRASDGAPQWARTLGGGIQSNPLVTGGNIYVGARDGKLSCTTAAGLACSGWTDFQADGPILYSPAYKDGVLYIAAMDGYVYAVNAATGARVWRSQTRDNEGAVQDLPIPGQGFHAYWPVIAGDYVLVTKRLEKSETATTSELNQQKPWLFADADPVTAGNQTSSFPYRSAPCATNVPDDGGHPRCDPRTNPWAGSASSATTGGTVYDWNENNPNRRTLYVLDRATGIEVRPDYDGDGTRDGAPFMHVGDAINAYPPVVLPPTAGQTQGDIIMRTQNLCNGQTVAPQGAGCPIPGSVPVQWTIGSPYWRLPVSAMSGQSGHFPTDEATGMVLAGNMLFWNLCCDRYFGGADLGTTNSAWPAQVTGRQWRGGSTGGPPAGEPPAELPFVSLDTDPDSQATNRATTERDYWFTKPDYYWVERSLCSGSVICHVGHGTIAAPIPYNNRLIGVWSNALIILEGTQYGRTARCDATVFSPHVAGTGADCVRDKATITSTPVAAATWTRAEVLAQLDAYVLRTVNAATAAGGLRSGWISSGNVNGTNNSDSFESDLQDIWHNPGWDNLRVLMRARPLVGSSTRAALDAFVNTEYANVAGATNNCGTAALGRVNAATTRHTGFTVGAPRGFTDGISTWGWALSSVPNPVGVTTSSWANEAEAVYGLWLWAEQCFNQGNAAVYNALPASTVNPPSTTYLAHEYNNYIAYCRGLLNLHARSGAAATARVTACQSNLPAAEAHRLSMVTDILWPFSATPPPEARTLYYQGSCLGCWNFLRMVPELATVIRASSPGLAAAVNALDSYQARAPYWFVALNDEVQMENGTTPYQQTVAVYQAWVMLEQPTCAEATTYLDRPVFGVGDMYWIDNAVAALERCP
jgi:outer membrane protein assembly factor BamB